MLAFVQPSRLGSERRIVRSLINLSNVIYNSPCVSEDQSDERHPTRAGGYWGEQSARSGIADRFRNDVGHVRSARVPPASRRSRAGSNVPGCVGSANGLRSPIAARVSCRAPQEPADLAVSASGDDTDSRDSGRCPDFRANTDSRASCVCGNCGCLFPALCVAAIDPYLYRPERRRLARLVADHGDLRRRRLLDRPFVCRRVIARWRRFPAAGAAVWSSRRVTGSRREGGGR